MAPQDPAFGGRFVDHLLRWFELRPRVTLVLMVLAVLGPFLTKPLNIDDPLFVWAARQIHAHPANPYGFEVNWYGALTPMWEVTQNPPLGCYYIAAAASFLGWSEPALHTAFLLPSVMVILGTYRLARRFCSRPGLAACLTFFTPVFLVSSNTLMCDTLMLAFWVWAAVFWIDGLDRENLWQLAGSGVLITLAALSKYYGACLIPLLAAYSLIARRRLGWWTTCLLIPVLALVAYQWMTHGLYGRGLLSGAGDYAAATRRLLASSNLASSVVAAFAFTGGCLAVATLLAPLLWPGRVLAACVVVVVPFVAVILPDLPVLKHIARLPGSSPSLIVIQTAFWAVGGATVLGLAVMDAWRRRDAGAWLLTLWVVGTFLFAGFVNWTVNGRSILPMVPAVAILLVRRLERGNPPARSREDALALCIAAGAVLAVLVARADFQFAQAARLSAERTYAVPGPGQHTFWFQGHWGFQYYFERMGPSARAVAGGQSVPAPEDLLAIPLNNSNVILPDRRQVQPWEIRTADGPRWLATSCAEVGAGFYSSIWGPLPFAFGRVPPERVYVYRLGQVPDKASEPSDR